MKTRISCRLSAPLVARLHNRAGELGCSVTALFTRLLERSIRAQKRRDEANLHPWQVVGPLCVVLLLVSGCTFARGKQAAVASAKTANDAKLAEAARQLTTGALDAVTLAPVVPPTALAKKLLQRDQEILGAPVQRLDVDALMISNVTAMAFLSHTFNDQRSLLDERSELQAKLAVSTAKLVEMGGLYEAERNSHIVSRLWHFAIGTLGLGGLIALCVFCPVALPVIGRLAGFLVGRLPGLAGYLGVVGHKALDATVRGIGDLRAQLTTLHENAATTSVGIRPGDVLAMIGSNLQGQQADAGAGALIDARRLVNNV